MSECSIINKKMPFKILRALTNAARMVDKASELISNNLILQTENIQTFLGLITQQS